MKFLSTRGVVAGLLAVAVAAVCIRLGFWQLERLEERRATNARWAAAMEAPVVTLEGDALAAVKANPEDFLYRSVRVTGQFDEEGSALLRGRARQGSPGVHLITPLTIRGEPATILVDRGWLPAADATTADPRPFRRRGPATVRGVLRLLPGASAGGSAPLEARVDDDFGVPTYQRLDPALYRQRYPDLLPVYVERTGEGAAEQGPPFAAPLPRLDDGSHLGYALQWFGFAAIALVGLGIVAVRAYRRG